MRFRNLPSAMLVLATVGLLTAGHLHAGSIWHETVWNETVWNGASSPAAQSQTPSTQEESSEQASDQKDEASTAGAKGNQATAAAGSATEKPASVEPEASKVNPTSAPAASSGKQPPEKHSLEKQSPGEKAPATENFIVQAASMEVALHAVERVGGKITHRLGIIDAVAADLTVEQIKALQESEGVKLHANRKVSIEK